MESHPAFELATQAKQKETAGKLDLCLSVHRCICVEKKPN